MVIILVKAYCVTQCFILISLAKSATKALIKCFEIAPAHRLISESRVKADTKIIFVTVGTEYGMILRINAINAGKTEILEHGAAGMTDSVSAL